MIDRQTSDTMLEAEAFPPSSLVEEARLRARRLGRAVLVSATRPAPACDPLAAFACAPALGRERHFWSCPSQGYELAGIGAAWQARAEGDGRFGGVARSWRALLDDALLGESPGVSGAGPLLLGGFAFDPLRPRTALWEGFPDALLTLPRLLLTRVDGACWLTVNLLVGPEGADDVADDVALLLEQARAPVAPPAVLPPLAVTDALPPEAWTAMIEASVAEMRRSGMEKVVLARESRAGAPAPFDPVGALARLREDYPGCFVFAVDTGHGCFLGASPERLVSLRRGNVWATCLAGSIARGAPPEEDRRLGVALLDSAKDREEHAIVVRSLREALSGLCRRLTVPDEPTLMKVRNVQHLYTPVVGEVLPGYGVLDLVERLHPTPAVGGHPREAALAIIRAEERMDRGWYAGPIGWVDAAGEGEFAVGLRSGLVRGAEAALFAGCGIVPDSDPARELAESRLKLRPMLAALGGER